MTLVTPTRQASIVQNFQAHYQISKTDIAVNHAGMSSMLSYQSMKAGMELKTDVELALHRGSAVSGTSSVAAQLKGLLNGLTTNLTSSSGTTLTESVFNDLVTLAYNNPVNLREVYCNMFLKRTINGYTTNTQRFIPAGARRQVDVLEVYESEIGILGLFKSRYQLQSTTKTTSGNSFVAIDPDRFPLGWLRQPEELVLGLDGDRERRYMVAELTLIYRSEKAGVGGTGFVPYLP